MSNMADIVREVTSHTVGYLKYIYKGTSQNTYEKDMYLIFPKDKNGNVRVSEQELRFAFVQELINFSKQGVPIHYTVETPTKSSYHFSEKGNNIKPEIGNGRAGQFDLVLHDEVGNRKCLVEFKSNNIGIDELEPSLLKLANPEEGDASVERFFIHIVESSDAETVKSIKEKLRELSLKHRIETTIHYVCISLNQREQDNTGGIIINEDFKFIQRKKLFP